MVCSTLGGSRNRSREMHPGLAARHLSAWLHEERHLSMWLYIPVSSTYPDYSRLYGVDIILRKTFRYWPLQQVKNSGAKAWQYGFREYLTSSLHVGKFSWDKWKHLSTALSVTCLEYLCVDLTHNERRSSPLGEKVEQLCLLIWAYISDLGQALLLILTLIHMLRVACSYVHGFRGICTVFASLSLTSGAVSRSDIR